MQGQINWIKSTKWQRYRGINKANLQNTYKPGCDSKRLVLQSVWRAGQKASTPDVIVECLLLKETRRTTVGAHVQLHSGPRLADVNVNSPGNPAVNNVFSLPV